VRKQVTALARNLLLPVPRPFLPPSKKGPAHNWLARLHQFCRNLFRASLADHLHVGHAPNCRIASLLGRLFDLSFVSCVFSAFVSGLGGSGDSYLMPNVLVKFNA